MTRKRYGVIIERKGTSIWQYVKIEYFSSLKKAKERKDYIDNNFVNFRCFGIFDYEHIVYKYIVKEENQDDNRKN